MSLQSQIQSDEMSHQFHVDDDLMLLELMLSDMKKGDVCFRPTHFWQFYEHRFLPELRAQGLRDFRRRHTSVLSSFGGTDPYLETSSLCRRFVFRLSIRWPSLGALVSRRLLFSLTNNSRSHAHNIIVEECYRRVKSKFAQIKMNLQKCPTSYVGNPEGVLEIEGRPWTALHLEYCSLFADAARYIKFRPESIFCELGTGIGRNVQILASLFEGMTFLMFDIPPQLYVANQYLKKIFGSRIISYQEANALDPASAECAKSIRGKIVLQPTWRMPVWSASTKIDVFWNSASFQEMEPDVVLNYLAIVKHMVPEFIYIDAMLGGNYHPGKATKGGLGTRAPILEKYYFDALIDEYELKTSYESDRLDGNRYGCHVSYVFNRKIK